MSPQEGHISAKAPQRPLPDPHTQRLPAPAQFGDTSPQECQSPRRFGPKSVSLADVLQEFCPPSSDTSPELCPF
ncbi:hypothetical protein Slala02_78260 [Streptomyces lavendulae subsp. lavendulae]|nr:hypothetical protein Slala01_77990 [Streptomyces lavendulae subsp. lavendulae]GLX32007.1 hypothetical protein Slala02_78260 [Streptomyces lavendulae subsp. lavendulae]